MKKKYFKFIAKISLAMFFILASFFDTQATNVNNFGYQSTIIFPGKDIPQKTLQLELPYNISRYLQKNGDGFQIIDEEKNEINAKIFVEKSQKIDKIKVLEVSSQKSGKIEKLVDNDALTSFVFENREDHGESFVILDLGKIQAVHGFKIYKGLNAKIKSTKILGGKELNKFKTISSKRIYKLDTDITNPQEVRYIKIIFYGTKIAVDDIQIYKFPGKIIQWKNNDEKKYILFFGGKNNQSNKKTKKILPAIDGVILPPAFNSLIDKDIDGDGVINKLDNCPFDDNSRQKDSDNDHIGNECDNAPYHQNSQQSDIDYDGIGDIADNCKRYKNIDQKDDDNDGIGNECDSFIDNPKDFLTNLQWAILLIVISIVSGGIWYYVLLKNDKK